jgi:predicted nucleic acid-binding protein
MRFWDSSALVPLVVTQAASPTIDQWFSEDNHIAAWTLTPVELVSALMRLVREGAMKEEEASEAESRVDELLKASHVVIDVEAVKSQSRRLLRLHPLRVADAMQLGAAWEWAAGRPTGRVFHTLDGRLALAARREGFRVIAEP